MLHLVSYHDHSTGTVPRLRILLNKHTDDAHENRKPLTASSPIRDVVSSDVGWAYDFGLLLENGYVLTAGVTSWEEGCMFFPMDGEPAASVHVLKLPCAVP